MSSLKTRYDQLRAIANTKVLPDITRIETKAFLERGLLSCVGVVVLQRGTAGLLHSVYGEEHELEELLDLFDDEERKAVIAGGARNYFEDLSRQLEAQNIPIVGSYCDDYMLEARKLSGGRIGGTFHPEVGSEFNGGWMKSLLIHPTTEEVYLHSERSGIIKLH